jgi:hypothetical protein
MRRRMRRGRRRRRRRRRRRGLQDLWSRLHMELQMKILGLSTLHYH